jgi:hypothetical protein
MRLLPRFVLALACAAWVAAQAQLVEEVPFVTSPDNVTLEMLRAANVGPGDHVIDLGSGDGRIVVVAARRFGATGLGVEIVPELVRQSRSNARDAGVADRVEFRQQDLFETDLGRATVVTMYLLPEVNLKLRPRLLALAPGTRIVSHDWDLGDWKPDRTTVVPVPDKKVGLDRSSKVHLWIVPERVEGLWCMQGPQGTGAMELTQRFQEVQVRFLPPGGSPVGSGRVEGRRLHLRTDAGRAWVLEVAGDTLRVSEGARHAGGSAAVLFTRARGGRC